MKYIFIFAFLFCYGTAFTQDDGIPFRSQTVTPDPSSLSRTSVALGGTYTIGGTSPDYANFTAAVSALVSQGVSAPVQFLIRPGIYNEQISISQVPGVSSVNIVQFVSENGDSTSVKLTNASSSASLNNYTLQLNGADYISFSSITIERSGTADYSSVVELVGGCDNNTFSNNVFIGPSGVAAINSTGSRSGIYADNTVNNDNLIIVANRFMGNANGLWIGGNSAGPFAVGLVISDNVFNTFYVGAFALYQNSPVVSGNDIVRNDLNSTLDFYGISLRYITGGEQVTGNRVICYKGSYGIRYRDAVSVAGSEGLLANNMVQIGDANIGRGISLEDDCAYKLVYHNSVSYNQTNTTGRAFNVEGTATSNIVLKNNCFSNSGGGITIYITTGATAGITASDYNCMYTTGLVYAYWATNLSGLTAWQVVTSGYDQNSLSVNPGFFSQTDLHVNTVALDNAGTGLGVTTDYDGDARNATTPDIGADEFTFSSIGEIENNYFSVSPNPMKSTTLIKMDDSSAHTLQVLNSAGQLVKEESFTGSSYLLSKENLASGIYFLKVTNLKSQEHGIQKLIVTE